MKRIHSLDLLNERRTPWGGWALAAVGLLVAGAAALPLWPLRADIEARNQALGAERRASAAADAPIELSPADRRRQTQARRLLVQLDAPWNELFNLLEQNADSQVGLLRLEPDAASGQIRVMAMARSLGAMAGWLRRLEQDPRLADVQILQHQVEDQLPGRPVRFNLVARWRGAAGGGATPRQSAEADAARPDAGPLRTAAATDPAAPLTNPGATR
ncbi:PilN domain-containing protein [Leptothrix discophora]|uniref:PilN domain-containing protein n=1 Tax=Leptothrix discophora TaxID=89 RepID=A0ABT9G225_LEPDI|nr:PilN domain-containing protein [Leptothrix discophora]MDP4300544.1 PilN domain-containing protein [Leptothrix discophora]